jgi:hypothetical protein
MGLNDLAVRSGGKTQQVGHGNGDHRYKPEASRRTNSVQRTRPQPLNLGRSLVR